MEEAKQFSVKWEQHALNLASEAECFFQDEAFLDCTLSAEGQTIQAHKLILSAASPHLATLLRVSAEKHPIIIFQEMRFEILKAIVAFIYNGVVCLPESSFQVFMRASHSLLLRGLTGVPEMKVTRKRNAPPPSVEQSPLLVPPPMTQVPPPSEESLAKLQEISFVKYHPQQQGRHARNVAASPNDKFVVRSWKMADEKNGQWKNGTLPKSNQNNYLFKKFRLEKPAPPTEPPLDNSPEVADVQVKQETEDSDMQLIEPKVEVMEEEEDEEADTNQQSDKFYPNTEVGDGPVPLLVCKTSLQEESEGLWQPSHGSESWSSSGENEQPPWHAGMVGGNPGHEGMDDLDGLPCGVCHKKYKSRYALNRGFSLDQMLLMLEENDEEVQIAASDHIDIVMMPPENGNTTDEDSGPEDTTSLAKLSSNQLRAPVELQFFKSDDESDDDMVEKKQIHNWLINSDIITKDAPWSNKDGRSHEQMPEALFTLFFDTDVMNHILTCSNQYALKKNKTGDITLEELKAFMGILLLSGYVTLPRRKLYWENLKESSNQIVSEALTSERFDYVMSNFHVCNNDLLDEKDRFAKVRPLFDKLNKRFQDFAPHEPYHCVGETMVPYFGRQSKQLIRGKPVRGGFKLWIGATKGGYVVCSEPYQGEGGLRGSVVLNYAQVLRTIGPHPYHLYFDSSFTSVDLLVELGRQGFMATGTLLENRLSGCPIKTKSELQKEKRGAISMAADEENNIVVCSWNDNNIVTICSNAVAVKPIRTVSRYSQKKRIQIPQPNVIQSYNQNMGGVDRIEQNINMYRISINGKKWYSCLLHYLIDLAENNAWQLHRSNGGTLDHLEFRRQIVMALLPERRRLNQDLVEPGRYDQIGHFVIENEKRTRCGLCHKQASTRCQKCDVGVHVKCFVNYHTK